MGHFSTLDSKDIYLVVITVILQRVPTYINISQCSRKKFCAVKSKIPTETILIFQQFTRLFKIT